MRVPCTLVIWTRGATQHTGVRSKKGRFFQGMFMLHAIHWTDLYPVGRKRLQIDPYILENTREVCLSTGNGSKLILQYEVKFIIWLLRIFAPPPGVGRDNNLGALRSVYRCALAKRVHFYYLYQLFSNVYSHAAHLRLINYYSPTNPKSILNPQLAHRFYDELSQALDVPARYEPWILGDFNAKIGKRPLHDPVSGINEIMGSFSIGRRNENGRRLADFCITNSLFIANSAFKHSSRHISTRTGWVKEKKSGLTRPYFSQIDYILFRSRSKSFLRSDHKLVIANVCTVGHKLYRKRAVVSRQYDTTTFIASAAARAE
eukprot:sb/3466942/